MSCLGHMQPLPAVQTQQPTPSPTVPDKAQHDVDKPQQKEPSLGPVQADDLSAALHFLFFHAVCNGQSLLSNSKRLALRAVTYQQQHPTDKCAAAAEAAYQGAQ